MDGLTLLLDPVSSGAEGFREAGQGRPAMHDFYSAAAQVLPVLVLAIVFEYRAMTVVSLRSTRGRAHHLLRLRARDCAADAFAGGRAGEIPGYRPATNVLRFRADELEAWLETRRS